MLDSTSFHNARSHFSFKYTLLGRLLGRSSILLFCDSCQYQFSWPRQRRSSTRRATSCEASSCLCGLRSLLETEEHAVPIEALKQVRFLKTHPSCMEKLTSPLISRLDLSKFSLSHLPTTASSCPHASVFLINLSLLLLFRPSLRIHTVDFIFPFWPHHKVFRISLCRGQTHAPCSGSLES